MAVGVVEGAGDFLREADGVVDGELLLAGQAAAEGLALDERHDVVEEAVGLAGVDQPQDVRMLQAGGDLDLGEEAVAADDGAQLGVQDLDGDLAAVLEVLGEVDRGHAALAELALEAVAVGKGCGEAVYCAGQGMLRLCDRVAITWSLGCRAESLEVRPPVQDQVERRRVDPAGHHHQEPLAVRVHIIGAEVRRLGQAGTENRSWGVPWVKWAPVVTGTLNMCTARIPEEELSAIPAPQRLRPTGHRDRDMRRVALGNGRT